MLHLDGAIDVELEVEASPGLIAEIVGHRPHSIALVKAWLIQQTMVISLRIVHTEIEVAEGNQYHELPIDSLGIPVLIGIAKKATGLRPIGRDVADTTTTL